MSNSNLVSYINCTSGHWNSRYGKAIDKIVIHHAAGILSLQDFARVFAGKQASATYCIDRYGNIGQYVDEAYRPWTTSSEAIDSHAVTIECSNDEVGGDWHVSDATLNSCIELVADIAKRNGIANVTYTGDKSGVLQMHRWYASTACPGPYLASKFPYIADRANWLLNPPAPVIAYVDDRKVITMRIVIDNKNFDFDLAPVFRLYNPNNGQHFWTTDASENAALLKAGWKQEKCEDYAVKVVSGK